jgi:SAM-dependent methyltransferase
VETTEQAAWDQRYSGPDLVWGAGPNRFVTDEVTALPAGRAVDLGTGEGRNAIWLAERGWQVTAVDFSAAGLARAARLAAERAVSVDWVQGGTLLVIGHDRENITRGHGGPQDPDRLYTPAEVTAELDGLAVRRAEQVMRPVRTPEGERTAIDTLVLAERPA